MRKEYWRINPVAISRELQRLPPDIDRFAETSNALCSRFSSAYLCPKTEAIDALAQD